MSEAPRGWVFRDGAEHRTAREVLLELAKRTDATGDRATMDAFLRAAAAEAALADAGATDETAAVAAWTDHLARALVGDRSSRPPASLHELGERVDPRLRLRLSVPEGFAYYALDPIGFAEAAARAASGAREVVVVGLRTIGAALSAASAALLARRGVTASRFTVRPTGHPYDRRLALTDRERAHVDGAARRGARFLLVDEGPGLSGTTLLAAAEALTDAGADAAALRLVGTRSFDPADLVGRDAPARFRRYAYVCADESQRALPDGDELSAGAWRAALGLAEASWPAIWPAMERRKALVGGRRELLKFEGFGAYGSAVYARAETLAAWGPAPVAPPDAAGFARYAWLDARPLAGRDLDDRVLDYLARYLAARTRLCAWTGSAADLTDVGALARTNVAAALGIERDVPIPVVERPIVVDGRLQPHELMVGPQGHLRKVDGASHGDDHFQPGPTDVAWDLAGVVVEWDLDEHARERLLELYRRASGDDACSRLQAWEIAYASTRAAWCAMAIVGSPPEAQPRLAAEAERLRAALRRRLR